MKYLTCGDKLRVPMTLVSGLSWTDTARTVEKTGGYSRSLGYEAVTLSVRISFNADTASLSVDTEKGLKALFYQLNELATDCVDEPARLIVGDFEPEPEMLFALTSCNRSQTYDPRFDPTLEMDLVFSGVRCVKEEARNNALTEQETSGQLPEIIIKRGGRELKIRDAYNLDTLVIRDSSVEIGFTVRDDLTIIDRDGYFVDMIDGKTIVTVDKNDYYVVSASVEANRVELTGSFWSIDSQKPFVKTYRDTDLKALFTELAERAGVKADVRVSGHVDYFLNATSPMDSIAGLVESCGALALWRGGKLMIVDVPEVLGVGVELEAQIDAANDSQEIISSCVWTDGLKSDRAGDNKGEGVSITSVYSGDGKAKECLKRAVIRQHTIKVECPVALGVEQGATVTVPVADAMVSGIVTGYEEDYLTWRATYYVSYI